MARIAIFGALTNAADVIAPLKQIAGHHLRLTVHHPGQRIRADVLLTDDTGFKTYDRDSSAEQIPIIVATRDPSGSTQLLDQGANAVIALPADVAEITSAIYALIFPGRYLSRRVVAASIARTLPDGMPISGLSAREIDVLTHLAAGHSDAEIATALFLAPATVHTHIINLRRKLGARNRTHAVALAIQHGLIPPHS
ncbi:response regulator transcription factor [uncultured Microbacterium sp.]|uniref:response regulator transcription factor n=1 Tax=uncultured Microbacterium sp. TaxID=191216 RepID=UPI00259943E5|nr:response regulator transcription factor [uncultured Microbacterium sp.]